EEERKFKCAECGRGYRHAGSLANHKKTHEVGSFQCDICGKENSNALALKSHLRSHTSQKKYSCAQCGKSFRLATQLATHKKVHITKQAGQQTHRKVDGDDPADETENDHPRHFSDRSGSLEMSVEVSETSDDAANRPFKCDLCEKSYIHHRSLTNHKKTHQVGMFECTVCFKLFNNMAALYSHQRTHKGKSGTDVNVLVGSPTVAPLDKFPPQSPDAQVHFCHLCQIGFANDGDFQEHVQMHNSSPLLFGLHPALSESHDVSCDGSITSPTSDFYASPINNGPSVSLVGSYAGFDQLEEQILSNGHDYPDCSNADTSPCLIPQGEAPLLDTGIPNLSPPCTANPVCVREPEEPSALDSDERPFKCQICGKSYRHSGSLINHKRSHQVGIYQCSICRKNYPHLAALKSHLRLHKSQPPSYKVNAEGDWLSSEPLTLDHQNGFFSSPGDDDDDGGGGGDDSTYSAFGMDQENETEHVNGNVRGEQLNQDMNLPRGEPPAQRHMCADCGETFGDIAGIKSHGCPLLQQQQDTSSSGFGRTVTYLDANGHCAHRSPGSRAGLHSRAQDQSYFEHSFPDGPNGDQPNGDEDETEEEEEDDGDLYQCSICGDSYTSMKALRSHLRGHTQARGTPPSLGPSSSSSRGEVKEEPGEMLICSACGESFASRQDLLTHLLLHQDDGRLHPNDSKAPGFKGESESIICGSCGVSCTSYRHLENHSCTTERETELAEEKTRAQEDVSGTVEAEQRQYKCEQCGRSYRHAGSLLNHKKSHKTGVFRCLVCQKRFYNLLALKNHQRSHFDIKRHTCQECGKAFKIQKQLLNHLKRHKENQAKIQELNTQIQALMQMNGSSPAGRKQPSAPEGSQARSRACRRLPQGKREPAEPQEGSRDQRPFACDQCGRTYRHAGSLVNHRNSHKTGEYYCSVCNNSYSNRLAMKNHMRTHFAYKKHSCQSCGKAFRGEKQLLAHVCAELRKKGTVGRRGLRSRTRKCQHCKQAFWSAEQLRDHVCSGPAGASDAQASISTGKEERPFTCNICNRSYRHAGSLLNHKNTHKTGHFSCTFCSKPFTNPMALRNHTRIHTQRKKYVCLTCGKAFRLASILHNHQRTHSRAAAHLSCPGCGKSFQGRSGLKRHRCHGGQDSGGAGSQQPDPGDKCFMCDLCGRSYRHAGSLLNHKKTHSESLHHCALCLQTFPDPQALQIHSQMKRHCCPECGKTFCLPAHLQSHMDVHLKELSVVCGTCQQRFPNAASYQQHRDAQHKAPEPYPQAAGRGPTTAPWGSGVDGAAGVGRPAPPPLSHLPQSISDLHGDAGAHAEEKSHVCEHCGRTYRHAGSLLNHKNSHKTGFFFCSVCQKEFTNLMALKNHRRIHTEPKRYQCVECGKAFRVSTQLICHRRIHTKEKPFACLQCSKSFSSKSNLRHHQKMHQ
ncbi:unnamed protein product, partial [Tetraodon nigroviridis]